MATTCQSLNLIRDTRNFQKCFIDLSTAVKFDLKKGDFCAIRISQQRTAICTVRFLQHRTKANSQPTLSYYELVTLKSIITQPEITKLQLNSSNQTINVLLVFKSIEDVLKYNKHKTTLNRITKISLKQMGITENCVIDCSNLPINSVFKTTKIVVTNIQKIPENRVLIVTDETDIKIDKLVSDDEFGLIDNELRLGGIKENYKILKPFLTLPNDEIRRKFRLDETMKSSIILYGPPGTGKTSLILKLAIDLNLRLIHFDCAAVWKSSIGESEEMLKSIFKNGIDLSRIDTCILFLDRIDLICSINKSHWLSRRLIARLQSLIDSSKRIYRLFIIAATNQIDSIDPSLRHSKYFDEEILIGIPNSDQRYEILNILIDNHPQIDFNRLAQSTPGYSAGDLKSLCKRIQFENEINTEIMMKIIKNFTSTSKRINSEFESTSKFAKWNEIGGLDEIKYKIWETLDLQLNRPDFLAHYGLPKPKGILLYGPPGCCKTTLVKAASNDLKLNYISITPNDIYSPYLGESEKAINEIFRKSRANAPTILFIDELDAFVGSRVESEQSTVHVRVLSTLLNEMDGIGVKKQEIVNSQNDGGVLVMAATNRPDLIDPALLRPGRFDEMIYLPPPNRDARKAILRIFLENVRIENIDFDKLADETELYSGVDLKNLCNEAGLAAMVEDGVTVDKIQQKHFEFVLKNSKPSLSEIEMEFYENFHR